MTFKRASSIQHHKNKNKSVQRRKLLLKLQGSETMVLTANSMSKRHLENTQDNDANARFNKSDLLTIVVARPGEKLGS
jgi:hypothetical protein